MSKNLHHLVRENLLSRTNFDELYEGIPFGVSGNYRCHYRYDPLGVNYLLGHDIICEGPIDITKVHLLPEEFAELSLAVKNKIN